MKAEWTNADSLSCEETTKAILVLNKMPKCCDGCPCTDHMFCYATQKELEIDWEVNKPSWCPLKPMPQPIYVEVNKIDDIMHISIEDINAKIRLDTDKIFSLGWNACLEEVEK